MIGVRSGIDEYGQPAEEILSGYVGEFKYFGFSDVPPHCLACDGSEVSRETYNELFEVFGTTFGAGDGVSTFNLPDLRGAFLRCIGGNAAALGTEQGDAIRNITGVIADICYAHSTSGNGPYTAECFYQNASDSNSKVGASSQTILSETGDFIGLDVSRVVPTASENRPINFAVNICVVYE